MIMIRASKLLSEQPMCVCACEYLLTIVMMGRQLERPSMRQVLENFAPSASKPVIWDPCIYDRGIYAFGQDGDSFSAVLLASESVALGIRHSVGK